MKDWIWIVLIVICLILFVPTCSVAVNAEQASSERLSPGWNLITVEGETASQYATKYPCISVIWHYVKPFDLWVAFFPSAAVHSTTEPLHSMVSTDYYMDYSHGYWVYCT